MRMFILATVAACATSTWAQSSCTYNSVDYSSLTSSSQDYTVQSEFYPNYEFVFNVCAQTVWTDDACPSGSGVCERLIESQQGTDVYGLQSTATWGSDSSGSYIDMNTNDQYPCMFGNDMVSRIYFSCDSSATTPVVSIQEESYYECTIYLKISTAIACGGGGGGGEDPGKDPNKGKISAEDEKDVGMILCVLFFVFGIIYFAGGATYLYKQKGERGWEMVPNKDFWSSIPGLVKDGMAFSYAKVKEWTGKGDNEGYQNV
eukprot:m.14461 g.14461  ORF g.14461 m.14461 type:complete len:260 (+) comp5104_c0_seq1:61-840(+)